MAGIIIRQGENTLQAAASALTAEAWAEGTLPGGAGTKSAKEWAGDAAASATGLSSTLAYFPLSATTNLADPETTDVAASGDTAPVLTTFANQARRLRSTVNGLLQAQADANGTFGVTRKYDVTAGTQYTVSMHAALPGWYFYLTGSPSIEFFNADGSFHSKITSGFTYTPAVFARSMTFTVPTGAKKVAFNLRNTTDFAATTNPMTGAALELCCRSIMLNEGATASEYAPYAAPGSREPDPDAFGMDSMAPVTLAVLPPYVFIRQPAQMSDTYDIVEQVKIGENPGMGITQTGALDFIAYRFIARTTSREATVSAFNQSTMIAGFGGDEGAPLRLNGMFLGGSSHGIIGNSVTMTAHGKTSADHGSIYQDGAAKQWVLVYRADANTLWFIAANTGTSDKWVITTNPPAGTLTHVSGGTNTANVTVGATSQIRLAPIYQNLTKSLYADGVEIDAATAAVYSAAKVEIHESYTLPNAAGVLDYLIANPGATTYNDASIPGQVRITNNFSWGEHGGRTLYMSQIALQAYARYPQIGTSPGDYVSAQQHLRPALVGDSQAGMSTSVWAYVPDMAPIGGRDYKATVNVTSNTDFVAFPRTSATDPTNPPSHFAMIGKDGSLNPVVGRAWGIHRGAGLGIPATRAAKVNLVGYMSSAEKSYPILIDDAAGDAVAGEVTSAIVWSSWFLPTDTTLTLPAVVYAAGNKHYAVVTAHATRSLGWVALPRQLVGQPVSVLKSDSNVTLHSDFVTNEGVLMTFATSYGDVVLEIG